MRSPSAYFGVVIILLCLSLASCKEEKNRLNEQISSVLSQTVVLREQSEVAEVLSSNTIPLYFSNIAQTEVKYRVTSILILKNNRKIESNSFFSSEGNLVRISSSKKINDPYRLSESDINYANENSFEKVVEVIDVLNPEDIKTVWEHASSLINIEEVEEYNLIHASVGTKSGDTRRVYILYLWGPKNPLNMPEEFPDELKNRIRMTIDLEIGQVVSDNTL